MSILKKPYEISIWDDIWDSASGKFVERRLAIIGSNKMTSPGRALEPTLTREVSGNRSFAFKMYKNYVDPLTGENVVNPFIQYLVAERKVKLKYGKKIETVDGVEEEVDCWYDFLIKNISEPSATGLYAYTLEDAHVVELSKNGFSVIFDEQQSNNLGTLEELATKALDGTDWTVETEKFVQRIEEPLVHLITTKEIRAHHVIDEFGTAEGVTIEEGLTLIPANSQVLAFYSCCKNKPYRFQFLYKADNKYHTDERQIVDDYNCQYYIDYPLLEKSYTVKNTDYGVAIPTGFSLAINPKFDNKNDSTISLLAKGGRFGFTQKSKYSDLFDRYMLKYTHTSGETYWGYDENTIVSPPLLENLVSGPACTSTDGWIGAYSATSPSHYNNSSYKPSIVALTGKWVGTTFKTNGELMGEDFNVEADTYLLQSCLKVTFPALESLNGPGYPISNMLINAGFSDNKLLIKTLNNGDRYILRIKIRDKNGSHLRTLSNWDIHLKDCTYSYGSGTYSFGGPYDEIKSTNASDDGYITIEYAIKLDSPMTEEEFQKKNIRLVFIPELSKEVQVYYIDAIEFFKRYDNENGEYIPLKSNSEILQVQTIANRYLYKDSELFGDDKISDITQLNEIKTQNLYYDTYKPDLYSTAEKQRSITIKESNYFNILQTLAETFEAWLEIDITRSAIGAVIGKKIRFNNYIGQNNYASFRYGVNLTDITRQHDSKTVVTKMVVKDNLNEHAPNGFCTIKRAGSNLTGENVLYNFDYYVSTGLMNGVELNKYLYQEATTANGLKYGYYTRLGQLNEIIRSKSDRLDSLVTTKAKLEGNIIAAETTKNQADTAYDQAGLDFYNLVGKPFTDPEIDAKTRTRLDVTRYYTKILTNLKTASDAERELEVLQSQKAQLDQDIAAFQSEIDEAMEEKRALNAQFYAKYYRFIQEGTWIKEDYIDDEKYYVDAQAALYNSCYPKVTYSINVMEISQLPGYEHFSFDLGDITYAEDPELFGEEGRAEVIITELSQNLDNPSKNTIKVQTYKNQFQDLFQKLTATSQQVQYNTGSYKKAERMASADNVLKREFLQGTLEDMSKLLESAGEQDVRWGEYGLIIQDKAVKSKQIRMVGGAILLSKENSDGIVEWVTGITSDGIATDLLTAGKINTEQIQIMAGSEPSFRWDAYGITAYDFIKADTIGGSIINGLNLKKFTRFDRFGFYGAEIDKKIINGVVYQDGSAWHPETAEEVMANANFALTWEGLKVTGNNNLVAFIGKQGDHIVKIGIEDQEPYLTFSNTGTLKVGGWLVNSTGLVQKNNDTITSGFLSVGSDIILNSPLITSSIWKETGNFTSLGAPIYRMDHTSPTVMELPQKKRFLQAYNLNYYGAKQVVAGKVGLFGSSGHYSTPYFNNYYIRFNREMMNYYNNNLNSGIYLTLTINNQTTKIYISFSTIREQLQTSNKEYNQITGYVVEDTTKGYSWTFAWYCSYESGNIVSIKILSKSNKDFDSYIEHDIEIKIEPYSKTSEEFVITDEGFVTMQHLKSTTADIGNAHFTTFGDLMFEREEYVASGYSTVRHIYGPDGIEMRYPTAEGSDGVFINETQIALFDGSRMRGGSPTKKSSAVVLSRLGLSVGTLTPGSTRPYRGISIDGSQLIYTSNTTPSDWPSKLDSGSFSKTGFVFSEDKLEVYVNGDCVYTFK